MVNVNDDLPSSEYRELPYCAILSVQGELSGNNKEREQHVLVTQINFKTTEGYLSIRVRDVAPWWEAKPLI